MNLEVNISYEIFSSSMVQVSSIWDCKEKIQITELS
jgi:hypothetical protein